MNYSRAAEYEVYDLISKQVYRSSYFQQTRLEVHFWVKDQRSQDTCA